MVLKAQPIFECVESLGGPAGVGIAAKADRDLARQSVILLSAQGRRFSQATAHRLAALERVVLICGRYEGVDERVCELLADEELSIGDYVLSGGELAAAVVLDATARLLPGVLGHADSSRYESFGLSDADIASDTADLTPDGVPRSTHGAGGLLDYPHYTRPAEFRGVPIPDVLAGGGHAAIRRWRRRMALAKTLRNRPDLLANATLSDDDREFLATLEPADR
jgi:tRNA (guanine37-N1)-methyltransferase